MAADPAALRKRLAQAEADTGDTPLADFFEKGETEQGEAGFSAGVKNWTPGSSAQLTPTARLLFTFLRRLEDADRLIAYDLKLRTPGSTS